MHRYGNLSKLQRMNTTFTDRSFWEPLITCFLTYNKQLNLSAFRDAETVWEKHICDSLIAVPFITLPAWAQALDVGTGWWFPLLPLAQVFPEISWTGIDARKKKTQAVSEMIATLWLTNVKVLWWRIEDHTDTYDLITARAVAYADKLLPRIVPRLRHGGKVILYKLFTAEEDMRLFSLIRQYGLRPIDAHTYYLRDDESDPQKILYVFEKISTSS